MSVAITPQNHPPQPTGDAMSPQEPTPTPDDETAVIKVVADALRSNLGFGKGWVAPRIVEALKSAGYELVNQVGAVHHEPDSWQHIVGGPSSAPTATDNQVINPSTVELTARWIGERESTHTWPEIREDDKARYRDAAGHLLATISYSDYCPRS